MWSGLVSGLQRQLGGSRRGGRHHQDHHDDHHDYNQDHYNDQDHGPRYDDHQHEQVKPLAWLVGVNEAKNDLLMESSCLSHLHQKFSQRSELLLM